MDSEDVISKLEKDRNPEEALEEEKNSTYSSKDARYHLGLGAGAAISGLGLASYHSFSSGRYVLGITSLGTALVGGSLFSGFAIRSYLKLGGKAVMKGYSLFDSGEENNLFEEMKQEDRK